MEECYFYSNMKTTCLIKPNFFLWTKLLGNLLLAKYITYVAATLHASIFPNA